MRSVGSQGPKLSSCGQRRLIRLGGCRSDWADAQADLSLRWAHSHIVGFVMSWLIYFCYSFQVQMPRGIQCFYETSGRLGKTSMQSKKSLLYLPCLMKSTQEYRYGRSTTKPTNWHVRQTKPQISLGICPV